MSTKQIPAFGSLYDYYDYAGTKNYTNKGMKNPRKTKYSITKTLSFRTLGQTRQTELDKAFEIFKNSPKETFSRADLSELLQLPINHITRIINDLLKDKLISVAGKMVNPRSNKMVETLKLNPLL